MRNGIVRGFSGICVLLTTGAHVEDLMVSGCGLIGIGAGNGVVTGNRVINTGQAGNSCDDHSCAPRGERRYYLTISSQDGDEAPSACVTGFHMASFWELFETSALYYDVELGTTEDDSGSGPPSGGGWVRTGGNATDIGEAGVANCNAYTSDSPSDNGTTAFRAQSWSSGTVSLISPWSALSLDCNQTLRVWCIED